MSLLLWLSEGSQEYFTSHKMKLFSKENALKGYLSIPPLSYRNEQIFINFLVFYTIFILQHVFVPFWHLINWHINYHEMMLSRLCFPNFFGFFFLNKNFFFHLPIIIISSTFLRPNLYIIHRIMEARKI